MSIISCTNKPYQSQDLGDSGNKYRNSYLEVAFRKHQEAYIKSKILNDTLQQISNSIDEANLVDIAAHYQGLKTAIHQLTIYRYIHGPFDYPQEQNPFSYLESIAAKHPELAISGDQGLGKILSNKRTPIIESEITKHHLLYDNKDITKGIYVMGLILSLKHQELLRDNSREFTYLQLISKMLTKDLKDLLYTWSPYRSGNFQELTKARSYHEFYSFIFTGLSRNIKEQILADIEFRDRVNGFKQTDLLERFEALNTFWNNPSSKQMNLESFCKGLQKGTCKKISRLLKETRIHLERSENEKAESTLLELSNSFNSFIVQINGDLQIQRKLFIKPNNKINTLSKQQLLDAKDHVFGETNNRKLTSPSKNTLTLQ